MNWDNLKTVAKFDQTLKKVNSVENENDLHKCSFNVQDQTYRNTEEVLKTTTASTSNSLLIESLVQLLCLLLDEDPESAAQSYKSICEQLEAVNLIDNSYSLKEFEEIRGQYQMQIYKIVCAARGQDIPIQLPTTKRQENVETCWSRYRREFDELSFIASGGFGKVFKAKHKLDCTEYAIKQIKINSTTIKLCHLAEVKTIAKLSHPNIVQYKAAWLEPDYDYKDKKEKLNISSQSAATFWDNSIDNFEESLRNITKYETDESSDFIQFERSNDIEMVSSSFINKDKTVSSNEENTRSIEKALCRFEHNLSIQGSQRSAILYIQMSLCQITLRKWLNERNQSLSFNEFYRGFLGNNNEIKHFDIIYDIFFQILCGIDYIHSKDIIHHDIKPSNIFLKFENDKIIAQLGDFGLACPLQDNHIRGIALGTELYAAPEQLIGKCNSKSDIFSLGIVLLELLLKFKTDMERITVIKRARNGNFPEQLNGQFTKLIKSLLNNEKERPTTKELIEAVRNVRLENSLRALNILDNNNDGGKKEIPTQQIKNLKKIKNENSSDQQLIKKLTKEIETKDKIINKLKQIINTKDLEIAKLKKII